MILAFLRAAALVLMVIAAYVAVDWFSEWAASDVCYGAEHLKECE